MTINYAAPEVAPTEELNEFQKYADALTAIIHHTRGLDDHQEFEIDQMINECTSDFIEEAIYAFFEVTEEEMTDWVGDNPCVAYWVSYVADTSNPIKYPALEEFMDNYEGE
jgi:hypothetical protein